MATAAKARATEVDAAVRVRRVRAADMANVIALDAHVTKLAKPDYWNDVFRRYGKQRLHERFFLVAENRAGKAKPSVLGFIIGENSRLGIWLDALRLGLCVVGRTGHALAWRRQRLVRRHLQ